MRRRISPEDAVSALYEEEGFYEVERGGDPESLYISRVILSDGKRELVVSVLDEDSFTSRGAIQDILLHAERLKAKFDGVCIAVPRKYAKAFDEGVMAFHGFGLVIYDNIGAEEVIPPRIREKRTGCEEKREVERVARVESQEVVKLRGELSRLLRILEEVEARLDRLEREQRSLISRLSRAEAELAELKMRPAKTRTYEEKPVEVKAETPKPSGNLPSYLKDNPWIDILSRRE